MQKQQRDEVFSSISAEETTIYRGLIREVRAQRKASSTGQFIAREVLEPRMDGLPSRVQDALNAVIARDEMGPMPGSLLTLNSSLWVPKSGFGYPASREAVPWG